MMTFVVTMYASISDVALARETLAKKAPDLTVTADPAGDTNRLIRVPVDAEDLDNAEQLAVERLRKALGDHLESDLTIIRD